MEIFGYSTTGPRKNNEDYFAFESLENFDVACVADGVGGSSCGEFASKFSVEQFLSELKRVKFPNLKDILQNIHKKLVAEAINRRECKGMATTFTGAYIQGDLVQFIHTGDSRLYLLRGNGLRQLTKDHTEVKRLINEGLLTYETAETYPRKNVLDSALGIDKDLMITFLSFEACANDRIIIATDGFYNVFSKIELRDLSIVNEKYDDFCNILISSLSKKMLTDNATFIVVEF